MKKAKKFLAILCACCMTLAMMAPAFAVEAAPISEYAGQTVQCVIVPDDPNQEPYTIDIAIPANATKAEEPALVSAAVAEATSGAPISNRAVRDGPFIELSVMDDVPTMMPGLDLYVGGGRLSETYLTTTVVFTGLKNGNGATTLYVRLENETANKSWTKNISLSGTGYFVAFTYGNTSGLNLEKGSTISAYAYPNKGYVEADSCTVNVSPYNYP